MAGNRLDKVAHWGMFLILTISFLRYKTKPQQQLAGLLWIILGGFLTEIIQQWIPGRNLDFYDGFADTIGVMSGYYWYRFSK